jgi:Family of unknown function (DUF6055)
MSYPFRRLAAGTIAGLALSVLASTPAFASVRPTTNKWPATVESAHFVVHPAPGVDPGKAQQVADNFEAAYATEVESWGFVPPISDGSLGGDARVDVYVQPTYNAGEVGEALRDDDNAATTSGYAVISPDAADKPETAAHELFHLIQYGVYARGAKFLKEGTAEWAAANVTGKTSWLVTYWDNPGHSLECPASSPCASPTDLSYSRWIFFDFLSERYGAGIVKEIYQQVAARDADTGSEDLDAIDAALAAHGSSLAQAFTDFSAANASGAYSFAGLAGATKYLHLAFAAYTGVTSIGLAAQQVAIDHLATGYVRIYSGDPSSKVSNCGAATLHLRVTIPAGAQSQPTFSDGTGVHRLNVNGNTAGADLPWTNCDGTQGVLAIANTSRTQDGSLFVVRISIEVTPPKPALGTAAPKITLLGMPVRATIARKRPYLSFRVKSSGAGSLGVLLKAHYIRGSFRLHAGVNKLKLRLPRSYRGGRHQIVFTAYSTTGARGKTLKRHVTITIAA